MAKIDIAREIVSEFPNRNYEAEQLAKDYTEAELKSLQSDLRNESNDSNESSQGLSEEPPVDPEEAEKSAEEAIKEQTESGESATAASGKKFKLRNQSTQYTDTTNGWTITGDEEKALPEYPSADLLERIKNGFLVEV